MFNGRFVNSLQADNNRQLHTLIASNNNSPLPAAAGSVNKEFSTYFLDTVYTISVV